ncbi:hypothetical protein CCACVL1_10824 [Corchorus capsularis]|uniref:Uncharacterized protein n=1 Tax=Corchorus capsularis TaxID=210143 RepID=A0A1R3IPA9_COCAP|nr:hypothetical protein CCACVL1_10824 [Corchorus capsularis]
MVFLERGKKQGRREKEREDNLSRDVHKTARGAIFSPWQLCPLAGWECFFIEFHFGPLAKEGRLLIHVQQVAPAAATHTGVFSDNGQPPNPIETSSRSHSLHPRTLNKIMVERGGSERGAFRRGFGGRSDRPEAGVAGLPFDSDWYPLNSQASEFAPHMREVVKMLSDSEPCINAMSPDN